MLLAVDVGNTQTALGLYAGEKLTDHWRLATERSSTADELGVLLGGLFDFDDVDGICLSSTVPVLLREWEALAEKWAHAPLLVVGPGVKTGIPIRYDDPREVGPHRIANSVAARARYGASVIVVDFGTSTNFDVVSADGEYVGGLIAPGIEISMDALFARAARLVKQEQMDFWNFYAQRLEDPERSGVTSYAGVVGFDAATENQVDLKTDITPKAATAAKIDQPLDVSFPKFGKRDWRGLEFDNPCRAATRRASASRSPDASPRPTEPISTECCCRSPSTGGHPTTMWMSGHGSAADGSRSCRVPGVSEGVVQPDGVPLLAERRSGSTRARV